MIESRAVTRLGENVKLLTYVSIFYLPLAFCAGLWSINENYDKISFGITSVIVAIGTYFVVGNLENVIIALRTLYNTFKQPVVNRMASDPDPKWLKRGQAFRSFEPRWEPAQPSEWYLVQYWAVEHLRKLLHILRVPHVLYWVVDVVWGLAFYVKLGLQKVPRQLS